MPFQDAEVAYSIGVGELGWQDGTGLKSYGRVTDWCTGREWPVNCMTVISTWWRSNLPFQRLSGRLNYYRTECTGNSISLEIGEFGGKMWQRKPAPSRKLGPRDSGWATLENGKETLMDIRVGVNILLFCSVSNSLSHTTLVNKVRGIFF